jgi:hypothetical protein
LQKLLGMFERYRLRHILKDFEIRSLGQGQSKWPGAFSLPGGCPARKGSAPAFRIRNCQGRSHPNLGEESGGQTPHLAGRLRAILEWRSCRKGAPGVCVRLGDSERSPAVRALSVRLVSNLGGTYSAMRQPRAPSSPVCPASNRRRELPARADDSSGDCLRHVDPWADPDA